jgi:hypothetical protein
MPLVLFADGSRPAAAPPPHGAPHWDKEQGILSWRGQVVMQFVQHAAAQEALLGAFQANGWAAQIQNPFPHPKKKETRERLHGACKNLTHALKAVGLRFGMRRKGQWVYWEEVARGTAGPPPRSLPRASPKPP